MRRLPLALLVTVVGCGEGTAAPAADAGREAEAGPPISGIVVHTTAPATGTSLAGPANATWAAYLGPGGTWTALTATSVGTYVVPFPIGDRYSVVFVCADENQSAYVDIYDRLVGGTDRLVGGTDRLVGGTDRLVGGTDRLVGGTDRLVGATDRLVDAADLNVVLKEPCELDVAPTVDLSGSFTHAPPATSWFDFGYVPDDRGAVLPFDNGTAAYELVNVLQGTWDLVFGFRDDSNGPVSKMLFERALVMTGDTLTVDADLTQKGFAPTTHTLTVAGLGKDESIEAPILYTVGGGVHGVDMGPQIAAGPNLTYSVVPNEQQAEADRYRASIRARGPMDLSIRGAVGVFHAATDLTVELPITLPDPIVTTVATAPYLRVSGKVAARAIAASYELEGFTRITDQVSKVWTYSTDAQPPDGTTLEIVLPDLSAAFGWKPSWALTTADTKVTLTAREKPTPLSDGTLERFASKTVVLPSF